MGHAFLNGAEYSQGLSNFVMLIERRIGEIIIPEGVDEIGNFAFCGCSLVRYIDIPDGLTSIGNQAFNGVGNANGADGKGPDGEVIIPDSVKVLSTNAFVWSGVRKFIVSKNIGIIKEHTFEGCGKCESYDFSRHENVPTLENVNAFNYMPTYNKAKIYVPPKLYEEWKADSNWTEYENFIFPKPSEGIEYTTEDSYGNNVDGYYVRGRGSFDGTHLVVPEKYNGAQGEMAVVGIDGTAFHGDKGLEFVYLPKSITYFGNYQLSDCTNLKRIYLPGFTDIGSFEFYNLYSLEYVKFGVSKVNIGGGVFAECTGVVYDFSDSEGVAYLDSYGRGLEFGANPVIRVPAALYEEWKADTNWTNYADYIVAAE